MSDGVVLRKEAETAIIDLSEKLQAVKIGKSAVRLDGLNSVFVNYENIHDAIDSLSDKLIKSAGDKRLLFEEIEFAKLPDIIQHRMTSKGISFMLTMGSYFDPEIDDFRELKRIDVMFAIQ